MDEDGGQVAGSSPDGGGYEWYELAVFAVAVVVFLLVAVAAGFVVLTTLVFGDSAVLLVVGGAFTVIGSLAAVHYGSVLVGNVGKQRSEG